MKPRTEKTAKPETKLVALFMRHRANASLGLEQNMYILRHPQTEYYEFDKYVWCLLVAVVVVFIVASQGWQTANAHSIGEKNLTRSIHPHLKTVKLLLLY